MTPHLRRHAFGIVWLLVIAGCVPAAQSIRTAEFANPDVVATRGTLLIVGGGSQPDDLVRRFVALAGGPGKARIAILPMATSDAIATGAEKEAQLDSLGADSFVLNFDRTHADGDSIVARLATVTGVWFPVIMESRLTAAPADVPPITAPSR